MNIRAVVHCTKKYCSSTFEFEFNTEDVSARICEGGTIELSWPDPTVLPKGWNQPYEYVKTCVYCPEHSGCRG